MNRQIMKSNEIECDNRLVTCLNGKNIQKMIRDLALNTIIEFRGQFYQTTHGINQGNSLSVRLNNIYLGMIERTIFIQRPIGVSCWRYMDDYLIYSENKENILQVKFSKNRNRKNLLKTEIVYKKTEAEI